jgi:hypothetical protein
MTGEDLVRELRAAEKRLAWGDRFLVNAIAAQVEEGALSPVLRDLAEGLLERLQNNRRRAVRAPSVRPDGGSSVAHLANPRPPGNTSCRGRGGLLGRQVGNRQKGSSKQK